MADRREPNLAKKPVRSPDETRGRIARAWDGIHAATAASAASWTNADRIALAAVTLVGGILRIARVGDPNAVVFDETYYAKDSCWYLLADPSICQIDVEQPQVHPPLAKWIMAIGIRIFGFDSVGWRIASVVAGIVSIVLLYLLARKILHSTLGATIASGLLALDFLHFVQSRMAMLDIFVPLFGLAAVLFVVYDRDRLLARAGAAAPPTEVGNSVFDRPWRLWAGVAAGCALASKWSGGLFLAGVLALTVVWEAAARRADGQGRVARRLLKEEGLSILLWLMVVPVVLYVLTYVGRIHGSLFAWPWSEGSWLGSFIDQQRYMADFHRGLTSTHSYQSPPYSWIVLRRAVSYYFYTDSEGRYEEIFAAGSPLVWWSSIVAVAYTAYRWVRNRSIGAPEGVILAGFFITYGPWLLPMFADRDAVFIFYLLPTVPFMCLALAYVATRMATSRAGLTGVGVYFAAAIALFVFYYPLLANVPISQPQWDKRIWIFDNCDKPPPHPVTSQITETNERNETVVRTTETTTDSDLSPTGWCWI